MKKLSDDVRIGVFICDCGSNIAGYLQMKELVEYTKDPPECGVCPGESVYVLRRRDQRH